MVYCKTHTQTVPLERQNSHAEIYTLPGKITTPADFIIEYF